MAQFSVYQNKNTLTKKAFPFLLDVQSNLLDDLHTTVVIPLTKFEKNKGVLLKQLTPLLTVEGDAYLMLTPQLAGISRKELGKEVCNLAAVRTEIINALDFLIVGI
ncbi:MAG TPA: CcdB family protein [Cellvibrio sp.]|nr:CcdB family protein [Cellvibrio sp.]